MLHSYVNMYLNFFYYMTLARIVRKRYGKSHYERKRRSLTYICKKRLIITANAYPPPPLLSFTQKLKIETRLKAV